jgi:hypothetical protein
MTKKEEKIEEVKKEDPPLWVKESLKNAALVEMMFRAFEENCNCDVCKRLREMAKEYQRFLDEFIGKK